MDKLNNDARRIIYCKYCGADMDLLETTFDNGGEFFCYVCLCGAELTICEVSDDKWDQFFND